MLLYTPDLAGRVLGALIVIRKDVARTLGYVPQVDISGSAGIVEKDIANKNASLVLTLKHLITKLDVLVESLSFAPGCIEPNYIVVDAALYKDVMLQYAELKPTILEYEQI